MIISSDELQPEKHLPRFQICERTFMIPYKWNNSRVTVREGSRTIISRELKVLSHLSPHPQLLLMMGHTEDLRIVYEPIMIGSLFVCLHQQKLQVSLIDICLQITDALLYLEDQDLVHSSVSSHAVQMVSLNIAKLGMMERVVMEDEDAYPPPESLYNWTSPEILLSILHDDVDGVAMRENDVYSLCCLIWEMCTKQIPWSKYKPMEILQHVSNGYTLKLDRDKMPTLLYRVMRQGLIWNMDDRDLDLTEIRDMLLVSRRRVEKNVSEGSTSRNGNLDQDFNVQKARKSEKKTHNPKLSVKHSDLQKFSKSALQTDLMKIVPDLGACNVPDNDSVTESDYSSCYSELYENSSKFPSSCSNFPAGSNLNLTSHPTKSFSSAAVRAKLNELSDDTIKFASSSCKFPANGNEAPLTSTSKALTKFYQRSKEHKKAFLTKYDCFQREERTSMFGNDHNRHSKSEGNEQPPSTESDRKENDCYNFQVKFAATKNLFEGNCQKEAMLNQNLNVSSGEFYRTAHSSLNYSVVNENDASTGGKTTNQMLNASSGGFYRTALTSPNISASNANNNKSNGTKNGNYMNYWTKDKDANANKVVNVNFPDAQTYSENKMPDAGFVKKTIQFYQGLKVDSDTSIYHSPAGPLSPVVSKDKGVQTDPEPVPSGASSRFLAESTPITFQTNQNKVVQTPPSMSPLFCSPLFQTKRQALNLNLNVPKKSLQDESYLSLDSSTVDFSVANGRQKMFTTALSQAQVITSPESVRASTINSKDTISSPYQTCIEEDDIVNNNVDTSPDLKRQAVVTFNSSVEEITTSIVSLMTDSVARDTSHEEDENIDNFDTVQETEDNYFDDDLNGDNENEPVNFKLQADAGIFVKFCI